MSKTMKKVLGVGLLLGAGYYLYTKSASAAAASPFRQPKTFRALTAAQVQPRVKQLPATVMNRR